jgi:hypothetical protein
VVHRSTRQIQSYEILKGIENSHDGYDELPLGQKAKGPRLLGELGEQSESSAKQERTLTTVKDHLGSHDSVRTEMTIHEDLAW